jgi:membrane-bound metal-dependent hydrolase YbcI (DUF457 family)
MFIGHFAIGFTLKRFAPQTNLGWLIAAVCFLDLLWPVFLIAGLESVEIDPGNTAFTPLNFVSYPYSHSLAMAAVWSIVLGAIYFLISKYRAGSMAVGIGVVSHWFLDWLVHRPDLPLYPGSDKFGLGIWNSVPATLTLEVAMFAAGLWIYLKTTRSIDRTGTYVLWVFVAFLVVSYIANVVGPPPPSPTALAFFAPLVWIYVALAWWADNHRQPITA